VHLKEKGVISRLLRRQAFDNVKLFLFLAWRDDDILLNLDRMAEVKDLVFEDWTTSL
jgi:hypothetical protein